MHPRPETPKVAELLTEIRQAVRRLAVVAIRLEALLGIPDPEPPAESEPPAKAK